jgi:hypothetical protein
MEREIFSTQPTYHPYRCSPQNSANSILVLHIPSSQSPGCKIEHSRLIYIQMFHDFLELMFRHLPGHDRVKKDEYNLVVQDTEELIQTSEWPRMMSPGSIILMNIAVLISSSPWDLERGLFIRCPHCHDFVNQQNATARWSVRQYYEC